MTAKQCIKLLLNIFVPAAGLLLLIFVVPRIVLFFMPFVLGYLVAMLANPLVTWLQKRISLKRKHSSLFITVAVLAVVIFVLYFVISRLFRGAMGIAKDLPLYYEELRITAQSLFSEYRGLLERISPALVSALGSLSSNFNETVSNLLTQAASPTVSFAGSAVRSVPLIFINSLIFLLSAFCFITEWESIQSFLKRSMPKTVKGYFLFLKQDLKKIFGSWLLAQFKIMFVVFAVLAAGFLLLSVKYALLLAALTAFLDFLPAFGVGFILWPWILLSLLKGRFVMALSLAGLYILTQAVRQVLQPKIMGDTMGLPPLWTLFFLFIGFRFYGIAGMIFSVPVGMFFLSLYRYGIFDGMLRAAGELAAQVGRLMQPVGENEEKNEEIREKKKENGA
ncbi:MAG: sporulation integral membrane protein YtvI [Eubacteriales bacterium]|nr:sporulation integral membrane protein YtvI [Eubacteriales bacterium]